jgi:hypothetical protein
VINITCHKLQSLNHAHCQRGGTPSTAREAVLPQPPNSAHRLPELFVLKIILTLCNSYQYLNGHILCKYCLEFILSIPIILILLVIQFILLRPDVLIFVATDKHFRIPDMAFLCEFMHLVLLFHQNRQINYKTTSTYQEHGEKN